MKIGIHMTDERNIIEGLRRIEDLHGSDSACQIFTGSPRSFYPRTTQKFPYEGGMTLVAHTSFVINLAIPVSATVGGMVAQAQWAESFGCEYIVVHAGSSKEKSHFKVLDDYYANIQIVLDNTSSITVLVENMAQGKIWGTKGSLGALHSVFRTVDTVGSPRLRICLDIAHAWGAGEDLDLISRLGDKNLFPVIHANVADPDVVRGSGRDRHNSPLDGGAYSVAQLATWVSEIDPYVAIIEKTDIDSGDVTLLRGEICRIRH